MPRHVAIKDCNPTKVAKRLVVQKKRVKEEEKCLENEEQLFFYSCIIYGTLESGCSNQIIGN